MRDLRILAGVTEEKELYFVELGVSQHGDQEPYFAGSGFTISPISEEKAEEQTREGLEDGELWRQAVEAENTELGLSEWVEHVIDTDGATSGVDNSLYYEEVELNGENFIFESGSCGQHEEDSLLVYSIDEIFFSEIMAFWKKYHLAKKWDAKQWEEIQEKAKKYQENELEEVKRLSLMIIEDEFPEDCGNCGRPATVSLGENMSRCERCANL